MITDAYGSRVQFQHTAARRRLDLAMGNTPTFKLFQHTAARRRLAAGMPFLINLPMVSTHSRPKAAGSYDAVMLMSSPVSTHSRPKAAGCCGTSWKRRRACFNTQPPEGGWYRWYRATSGIACFNTQPPEGGWQIGFNLRFHITRFNTQPPEGGWTSLPSLPSLKKPFQHTAARRRLGVAMAKILIPFGVSTHSRPKAAGFRRIAMPSEQQVSTHSRPKAAGCNACRL